MMLTLIFIVLKLTGNIDWSWWWVLSPIWISVLAVISGVILLGTIGLFMVLVVEQIVDLRNKNRKNK